MTTQRKPKERTCKAAGCTNTYVQYDSLKPWCSEPCRASIALMKFDRQRRKEKIEVKRERRAIKQAYYEKNKPYQLKKLQASVNRYVTYVQEAGKPCYTCGFVFVGQKMGGVFDCGHSFSRGAHPELRYETRLMRRQCITCNRFNGGRPEVFKEKLRQELGSELYDEITTNNDMPNWSCEFLISERKRYNQMLKDNGILPP